MSSIITTPSPRINNSNNNNKNNNLFTAHAHPSSPHLEKMVLTSIPQTKSELSWFRRHERRKELRESTRRKNLGLEAEDATTRLLIHNNNNNNNNSSVVPNDTTSQSPLMLENQQPVTPIPNDKKDNDVLVEKNRFEVMNTPDHPIKALTKSVEMPKFTAQSNPFATPTFKTPLGSSHYQIEVGENKASGSAASSKVITEKYIQPALPLSKAVQKQQPTTPANPFANISLNTSTAAARPQNQIPLLLSGDFAALGSKSVTNQSELQKNQLSFGTLSKPEEVSKPINPFMNVTLKIGPPSQFTPALSGGFGALSSKQDGSNVEEEKAFTASNIVNIEDQQKVMVLKSEQQVMQKEKVVPTGRRIVKARPPRARTEPVFSTPSTDSQPVVLPTPSSDSQPISIPTPSTDSQPVLIPSVDESASLVKTFQKPVDKKDLETVTSYRERLITIYQKHNPSKLKDVEKLLRKYDGRHDEMFQKIEEVYNVEKTKTPGKTDDHVMSSSSTPQVETPMGEIKMTDEQLLQSVDDGPLNQDQQNQLRRRLIEFYKRHNASKVDSVDKTLEKFKGTEESMLQKLREKYITPKDGILPPCGNGPTCFLDIEIDHKPVGTIQIQLYADKVPLAAENFRALCTGELGIGPGSAGKPLCYRNCAIHRVVPGFCIQGGDFTKNDGTGGASIYPPNSDHGDMWGKFKDEMFMAHTRKGLLSMANNGANRNGSQFFVTLRGIPHLNKKHVVFGEVIKGMDIVERIAQLSTDKKQRPITEVRIANCGEIKPDGTIIKASDIIKATTAAAVPPMMSFDSMDSRKSGGLFKPQTSFGPVNDAPSPFTFGQTTTKSTTTTTTTTPSPFTFGLKPVNYSTPSEISSFEKTKTTPFTSSHSLSSTNIIKPSSTIASSTDVSPIEKSDGKNQTVPISAQVAEGAPTSDESKPAASHAQEKKESTKSMETTTMTSLVEGNELAISPTNLDPFGEGSVRDRVIRFYQKYNLSKLGEVDRILEAYDGQFDLLFERLLEKYNLTLKEKATIEKKERETNDQQKLDTKDHIKEIAVPTSSAQEGSGVSEIIGDSHAPSSVIIEVKQEIEKSFSHDSIKDRLTRFYQKYNPKKLHEIDRILEAYDGQTDLLMDRLLQKYNLSQEALSLDNDEQVRDTTPKSTSFVGVSELTVPVSLDPVASSPGQLPSTSVMATATDEVFKADKSAEAEILEKTRNLLTSIYTIHKPSKLKDVDKLLRKFKGRELEMFQQMEDVYKIKIETSGDHWFVVVSEEATDDGIGHITPTNSEPIQSTASTRTNKDKSEVASFDNVIKSATTEETNKVESGGPSNDHSTTITTVIAPNDGSMESEAPLDGHSTKGTTITPSNEISIETDAPTDDEPIKSAIVEGINEACPKKETSLDSENIDSSTSPVTNEICIESKTPSDGELAESTTIAAANETCIESEFLPASDGDPIESTTIAAANETHIQSESLPAFDGEPIESTTIAAANEIIIESESPSKSRITAAVSIDSDVPSDGEPIESSTTVAMIEACPESEAPSDSESIESTAIVSANESHIDNEAPSDGEPTKGATIAAAHEVVLEREVSSKSKTCIETSVENESRSDGPESEAPSDSESIESTTTVSANESHIDNEAPSDGEPTKGATIAAAHEVVLENEAPSKNETSNEPSIENESRSDGPGSEAPSDCESIESTTTVSASESHIDNEAPSDGDPTKGAAIAAAHEIVLEREVSSKSKTSIDFSVENESLFDGPGSEAPSDSESIESTTTVSANESHIDNEAPSDGEPTKGATIAAAHEVVLEREVSSKNEICIEPSVEHESLFDGPESEAPSDSESIESTAIVSANESHIDNEAPSDGEPTKGATIAAAHEVVLENEAPSKSKTCIETSVENESRSDGPESEAPSDSESIESTTTVSANESHIDNEAPSDGEPTKGATIAAAHEVVLEREVSFKNETCIETSVEDESSSDGPESEAPSDCESIESTAIVSANESHIDNEAPSDGEPTKGATIAAAHEIVLESEVSSKSKTCIETSVENESLFDGPESEAPSDSESIESTAIVSANESHIDNEAPSDGEPTKGAAIAAAHEIVLENEAPSKNEICIEPSVEDESRSDGPESEAPSDSESIESPAIVSANESHIDNEAPSDGEPTKGATIAAAHEIVLESEVSSKSKTCIETSVENESRSDGPESEAPSDSESIESTTTVSASESHIDNEAPSDGEPTKGATIAAAHEVVLEREVSFKNETCIETSVQNESSSDGPESEAPSDCESIESTAIVSANESHIDNEAPSDGEPTKGATIAAAHKIVLESEVSSKSKTCIETSVEDEPLFDGPESEAPSDSESIESTAIVSANESHIDNEAPSDGEPTKGATIAAAHEVVLESEAPSKSKTSIDFSVENESLFDGPESEAPSDCESIESPAIVSANESHIDNEAPSDGEPTKSTTIAAAHEVVLESEVSSKNEICIEPSVENESPSHGEPIKSIHIVLTNEIGIDSDAPAESNSVKCTTILARNDISLESKASSESNPMESTLHVATNQVSLEKDNILKSTRIVTSTEICFEGNTQSDGESLKSTIMVSPNEGGIESYGPSESDPSKSITILSGMKNSSEREASADRQATKTTTIEATSSCGSQREVSSDGEVTNEDRLGIKCSTDIESITSTADADINEYHLLSACSANNEPIQNTNAIGTNEDCFEKHSPSESEFSKSRSTVGTEEDEPSMQSYSVNTTIKSQITGETNDEYRAKDVLSERIEGTTTACTDELRLERNSSPNTNEIEIKATIHLNTEPGVEAHSNSESLKITVVGATVGDCEKLSGPSNNDNNSTAISEMANEISLNSEAIIKDEPMEFSISARRNKEEDGVVETSPERETINVAFSSDEHATITVPANEAGLESEATSNSELMKIAITVAASNVSISDDQNMKTANDDSLERKFVSKSDLVNSVPVVGEEKLKAAVPLSLIDSSQSQLPLSSTSATSTDTMVNLGSTAKVETLEKTRNLLISIYTTHNPSKLKDIDKLLRKFEGRESEMFQRMEDVYKIKIESSGDNWFALEAAANEGRLTSKVRSDEEPIEGAIAMLTNDEKAAIPNSELTKSAIGAGTNQDLQEHDTNFRQISPRPAASELRPVVRQGDSDQEDTQRIYRERLVAIYKVHNASKLQDVEKLLRKFKGNEIEMFKKVSEKYNLHLSPTGEVISPATSTTRLDEGKALVTMPDQNVERRSSESASRPDQQKKVMQHRLKIFFEKHNPSRVESVDEVLELYKGREHMLFRKLKGRTDGLDAVHLESQTNTYIDGSDNVTSATEKKVISSPTFAKPSFLNIIKPSSSNPFAVSLDDGNKSQTTSLVSPGVNAPFVSHVSPTNLFASAMPKNIVSRSPAVGDHQTKLTLKGSFLTSVKVSATNPFVSKLDKGRTPTIDEKSSSRGRALATSSLPQSSVFTGPSDTTQQQLSTVTGKEGNSSLETAKVSSLMMALKPKSSGQSFKVDPSPTNPFMAKNESTVQSLSLKNSNFFNKVSVSASNPFAKDNERATLSSASFSGVKPISSIGSSFLNTIVTSTDNPFGATQSSLSLNVSKFQVKPSMMNPFAQGSIPKPLSSSSFSFGLQTSNSHGAPGTLGVSVDDKDDRPGHSKSLTASKLGTSGSTSKKTLESTPKKTSESTSKKTLESTPKTVLTSLGKAAASDFNADRKDYAVESWYTKEEDEGITVGTNAAGKLFQMETSSKGVKSGISLQRKPPHDK